VGEAYSNYRSKPRKILKTLLCRVFNIFLGFDLSTKRCNSPILIFTIVLLPKMQLTN